MDEKRKKGIGGAIVAGSVLTSTPAIKFYDWIGRVLDAMEMVRAAGVGLGMLEPRDFLNLVLLVVGVALLFDYVPFRRKTATAAFQPDATERQPLTVDYLRLTPAPRPDFDKVKAEEFDYPYPKAVLKAEIERPKGTREQAAGASKPHRTTIVMTVKNDHGKLLKDCSVALVAMAENGDWWEVNERLQMGRDELEALIAPRTPKRFPLLIRDMSDMITPAPFLLRLETRQLPLNESSTYLLVLELRSHYPLPTIVVVQIDTGEGLDAEAKIIEQKIAEESEAKLNRSEASGIPSRDTKLDKALIYAVTGDWGGVLEGNQMIDDLQVRLAEFEQAARDNELLVWGKEVVVGLTLGPWEIIDPKHWKTSRVNWFSIVVDEHARTERRDGSKDEAYTELMVSRTQVGKRWPSGK